MPPKRPAVDFRASVKIPGGWGFQLSLRIAEKISNVGAIAGGIVCGAGAVVGGLVYLIQTNPDLVKAAVRAVLEEAGVEVMDTRFSSILVEVLCTTKESFLAFMDAFETNKVKQRLEEEFQRKLEFKGELEVTIANEQDVFEDLDRLREGRVDQSKMGNSSPSNGQTIPGSAGTEPSPATGGVSLICGSPIDHENNEGCQEDLPRREAMSGTWKHLSSLPRPIPQFVNRKKELADIEKYLSQNKENDCKCILIHGVVGMGKTATAIKAANEIRDNSDNTAVVYVNCQYLRSLEDLSRKIAEQVFGHGLWNDPIPEKVKRRLISEEDLYTVLLLDNYEHLDCDAEKRQVNETRIDPEEALAVKKFIGEIVKVSSHVKLLVTSFKNVHFPETGQKWVQLTPLENDDSFMLLKNVYGGRFELEKETAYEIAQFCSGIPLALTILASWQDFPRDLVQMMRNANEMERYEKFTKIPTADNDKKLDVCLDACFDRLDSHLQDALVSLTLFRGWFTMSVATEVFHSKALAGQILELAQWSFLEQSVEDPINGPCWYSFLTVQKLYCQNKARETRFHDVYQRARYSFIEYFLAFLEKTFKTFLSKEVLQAITAFRQHEENILQLLDWLRDGGMERGQMLKCIDVFNKVAELLAKMMGKQKFKMVFTQLKTKSKKMEDQKRLSECLTSLGIREVFNLFLAPCQRPEKTVEKAKQYLERSHRIQTDLQINDGDSRAQCLAKLGRCLAKENKFADAKDMIQRAIDIRKRDEEQGSVMLGATFNDLAVAITLEAANQPQAKARKKCLQEAIDIRKNRTLAIYKRKLGTNHPFTATILNSLSDNYLALGDLDNAKRYSEKALQIRRELLETHTDTAKSLFDLAMVNKARGELWEAKDNLEECEAMGKMVLDDNLMDLARTRRELEDVRKGLGDLQLEHPASP